MIGRFGGFEISIGRVLTLTITVYKKIWKWIKCIAEFFTIFVHSQARPLTQAQRLCFMKLLFFENHTVDVLAVCLLMIIYDPIF